MAKSKPTQASAGYSGAKAPKRKKLMMSDPPVIIGGGSVNVFFKSNANEVIPSPITGYRCFKLPGNIKKLSFYNGTDPGSSNMSVKNPKTFFVQADEE
jgi:hypothetical protein